MSSGTGYECSGGVDFKKCTVFRTGVHKEIGVCAKTWEYRFVLGNSCGSPLKRVCAEVEDN